MNIRLKELLTLHFLNDGVRTTFVILLPFISKDLSLSIAQVGFLGSSQPLIAALLALPTGFIIGKFGRLRIILTLLLIYSIGTIGVSFSFDLITLLCTYLIAALGFGMFHTVGFVSVAKNSKPTDVGRNMANFASIGDIGRIAIPPLAIFVASFMGWRLTMISIGTIGLLLFFIFRLLNPKKDKDQINAQTNSSQNHKEFLTDIIKIFKQEQGKYITVAAIIDSLASSPVYVYLPFLLINKGMNPAELSLVMGSFFIGSLAGKSLLGRSVDKIGNLKVFIISEICMAISLLFIVLATQFFLLILLGILLGIFTKGTSPVIQTMFSKLTDKTHYHKVFAVSEMVIGLAGVLTIVAMGTIADRTNINIIFYISAVLAILAALPIYSFSKRIKKVQN